MEKKLTAEEAEAIQVARDKRRTKLFKEFCREMANLPEDFSLGMGMTEEVMNSTLEPVSNRIYLFMKKNEMMAGDIEYVKTAFETIVAYTLNRVTNFAAALVMNATLKHFGVSDIITDLPLIDLEKEGLVVLSDEDMAELAKEDDSVK